MKTLILLFLLFTISARLRSQCNNSNGIDETTLKSTFPDNRVDGFVHFIEYFIESMFKVRADIYYSNSSVVNAYALKPRDGNSDATIVLTQGLIDELFTSNKTKLAVVLAHEYGHVFQYRIGTGKLKRKQIELHADYMAGEFLKAFVIAQTDYAGIYSDYNNYPELLKTESNYGDYYFNDTDHHGTPDERYNALLMGSNNFTEGFPNNLPVIQIKDFYMVFYKGQWIGGLHYVCLMGLDRIYYRFRLDTHH